jgi:hypothetical protein
MGEEKAKGGARLKVGKVGANVGRDGGEVEDGCKTKGKTRAPPGYTEYSRVEYSRVVEYSRKGVWPERAYSREGKLGKGCISEAMDGREKRRRRRAKVGKAGRLDKEQRWRTEPKRRVKPRPPGIHRV